MAILMVAKQHHYASLTTNQQNLEKILGRTKFNMSSIHYHYPCSSFKSPTHKQQYQTKIMAMKYHHEASLINSNTQHGVQHGITNINTKPLGMVNKVLHAKL
jgi:hypothetical protein